MVVVVVVAHAAIICLDLETGGHPALLLLLHQTTMAFLLLHKNQLHGRCCCTCTLMI